MQAASPIGSQSATPVSLGQVVSPPQAVRIAIVALLLVVLFFGPIWHGMVSRWISDGDWSHGLLIPLLSLYFLYLHRDELARAEPRGNYLGALIIAVAVAGYFFSAWWARMGYPQALSVVVAIFGVTLLMGGWPIMRIAWFPIAYLFLAVPIPDRLYTALTMPLRRLASTVSAAVMPYFADGLHTEAQAVVIDYVIPGRPPGTLNVEEACSGMRSLMAFITIGVAMAYLVERPTWQRVVLLVATVPIAVFCNTVRVTITGLLHVHGYPELARGTAHSLLGVAMFVLALGLYWVVGFVLSRLFVEEAHDTPIRA